jgi:hypothetical protein
LEGVEVESPIARDSQLAIERAFFGKLFEDRIEHFGRIAIERFFVAALDQYFIAVTKDENAKPIPLGLVNPVASGRDLIEASGEPWKQRRVDRQVHARCIQGDTGVWMLYLARAVACTSTQFGRIPEE